MISIQCLVCRVVVKISIANFLMIWDKVALDESVILHRLTRNETNRIFKVSCIILTTD